jgi:hypothetical protein
MTQHGIVDGRLFPRNERLELLLDSLQHLGTVSTSGAR